MHQSEKLEEAKAASKNLPQKPDNETLLKMYSLYKQATHGDVEGDGPDNPFDFVAKAKHNAWAELKGLDKEKAAEDYITLVESLKAK